MKKARNLFHKGKVLKQTNSHLPKNKTKMSNLDKLNKNLQILNKFRRNLRKLYLKKKIGILT